MPRVLPFAGLRYDPRLAPDLAGLVSPPYDVITPEEQRELQTRPAYNMSETRFAFGGQSYRRRDLLAALGVEPWSTGAVLPHEHTMAGPKADRLELLRATHANVSPIWVLARDQPSPLAEAWSAAERREPDLAFSWRDEQHRVWVVDDPGQTE